MTKHYELGRDPGNPVEYFRVQRTYMQRHYSTAQREEIRAAVGKVTSLATTRPRRGLAELRRARTRRPSATS